MWQPVHPPPPMHPCRTGWTSAAGWRSSASEQRAAARPDIGICAQRSSLSFHLWLSRPGQCIRACFAESACSDCS